MCDAVGRGGETNARNVDAAGGLLTRSLSTTRRAVTATSDSKKAAERAAEQRFINSAKSVPLVPPKQQRLSAAALKRQQLRTMDPTKISPTRRLPSSASAVPAVGVSKSPPQKRRRTSATGSTRIFEDDVPIAEQLDFLCDAVGRGGETNARNVDAAGGLLTRSLSTTRRAVTATSDSKKAAERAAEQRFINSAKSVPLVPPKQQRLSAAALKRQQLRTMDPTKISPTRRLPSSASAVPAVGVSKSSRQHVAATKLSAGISKQQQSVAQKKAKPFDF